MVDILQLIRDHRSVIDGLETVRSEIEGIARRMAVCLEGGGKILWMGNGGSAADCQHLAAEFVGRFVRERRAWPSVALTTDTSILTAVANDYSFDSVFARQIEALCRPEDLVVGISTSGNSGNVLSGLRRAKEIGAFAVALTGGNGGAIRNVADAAVIVPSAVVARIQEAHILIGHIWCECVESYLTKGKEDVQRSRPRD